MNETLSGERSILRQRTGSGTSKYGVGIISQAEEASRARSDDEFVSKLGGAIQEADESSLWLELLREECGVPADLTASLERESCELIAIFTTMINRTREKQTAENRNEFRLSQLVLLN